MAKFGTWCAAIVMSAVLLETTAINGQQGLTLVIGRRVYSSSFLEQNISVKNDTTNTVREVKVECGFFNQGQLIATDTAYLENIAPGTAAHKTVMARSDINADRAECRIVSAR